MHTVHAYTYMYMYVYVQLTYWSPALEAHPLFAVDALDVISVLVITDETISTILNI